MMSVENEYMPMTQVAPTAKSSVVYDYVILFQWNPNNKHPLFMRPLCSVDQTMFPMQFVTGSLKKKFRKHRFKMGNGDDLDYSLFCKVQEGTCFYLNYE